MTKTAKCCAIFFISSLWLLIWRVVFSYLDLSDNISSWVFSIVVQIGGMGIIPLLLYKFWVKDDVLGGLYIKFRIPPCIWGFAVLCGVMVSVITRGVSILWQNALIMLGYTHVNSVGTIYSDVGVLAMEILTVAVLPAIFEEITDRGVLLRAFGGINDDKMVMVAIAALFALGHQNVLQTGYTFVAGLVFAFFAIKTKSILPGMIMHFINNFISVITGYLGQRSATYMRFENMLNALLDRYFILFLLFCAGLGVGLIFLLRHVGRICKAAEKKATTPSFVIGEELFDGQTEAKEATSQTARYEYAFVYGAAVMLIATTMFTFVWGIIR